MPNSSRQTIGSTKKKTSNNKKQKGYVVVLIMWPTVLGIGVLHIGLSQLIELHAQIQQTCCHVCISARGVHDVDVVVCVCV